MKHLRRTIIIVMNVFLCGSIFSQTNNQESSKPNIILILADDMGWADSELYGSTYYETPNLSRLASEGMHFTNAYAASPLCSPTRASIMSGQHPARLRMTVAITTKSVSEPKSLPPKPNQYCGDAESINHLPLEIFTFAEALKETGYNTAHIGKWHLSTPHPGWKTGDAMYNAEHQGFDFVIGGSHLPGPPDYYSPYKKSIQNLSPGPEGEYLNERLAEESIKWIESVKDAEAPFYLNFWHYAVHGPIIAKKDLMPKYLAKTDPQGLQDCPEMGTMLESMDNSIGMLLDWLDLPENKTINENTIIIFASDNGGVAHNLNVAGIKKQITSNRPLRGGKANTYEGGTRIPWIVRWPGKVKPGSVSDTPISTVDIYPTLLEISGTKPKPEIILDGENITSILKGESMDDRPLFFDFPHVFGILSAPSTTVRMGDFKLLRFYWAGKKPKTHYYELYNWKQDPSEAINLATYMPEKVKELDALISQHLEETKALIPIPNENFSGDPLKLRSSPNRAPNRPRSLQLSQTKLKIKNTKGSQKFQLLDEKGNPRKTTALVLNDSPWIQIKNLSDGQVQVSWDRNLKKEDAKVLFGWNGGKTVFEMNDWTFDPIEVVIE